MTELAKKRISAVIALIVAICILLSGFTIYRTGIISGLNPYVDTYRENIIFIVKKNRTIEGPIVDRNGSYIVKATNPGDSGEVVDPECYSYIVGFNSAMYGLSGLRSQYKYDLYDGKKDGVGAELQLTLDSAIQKECYKILGNNEGSVSVINVSTGEIIALASRSGYSLEYNVNKLNSNVPDSKVKEAYSKYESYASSGDRKGSFFLNRAIMREDPPGSTFKIITATSQIENKMEDFVYNDNGTYSEVGRPVSNYGGNKFGKTNLEQALNKSVNTYFASVAVELGGEKLGETAKRYMYGEDIELDFCTLESTYGVTNNNDLDLLARTGFGQGSLSVSPLQICMTMQALLNDGVMLKPYLINKITDDGKVIYKADKGERLSKVTDRRTRNTLLKMLESTADGYNISRSDGKVYAKTGTAEVVIRPDSSLNAYNNSIMKNSKERITYHKYLVIGYSPDKCDDSYAICIDLKNIKDPNFEIKQAYAKPLLDYLSHVKLSKTE